MKIRLGAFIVTIGIALWWLIAHCNHEFSRPFTMTQYNLKGEPGRRAQYVVCLKCGKEFFFDWDTFKVGKEIHVKDYIQGPGMHKLEVEERPSI
jgi:hypothetical protein